VHNFAETPVVSEGPRAQVPIRESLVVLTRDPALAETLKGLGSDHNIVTVAGESDLAGELVGEHMGVAIIDASAVASAVAELTEKLKSQFPDLVLIVAGNGTDQTALAAQITHGTVYRFLHKPVSDQRVRLFVDAAWRRHEEALSGGVPDATAPAAALADERAPLPRSRLFVGGAALIALLAAGDWLLVRKPASAPVANTVAPNARDEQLESLLTRADAALASGTLVAPAGYSAVDLYRQALHRNSGDPRAADGIENVMGRLLSAAEEELSAQHLDAAQKLTDQARAIQPDHLRVAFLSTRIGKARERSVLSQARQAASKGNIEAAPGGNIQAALAVPEDTNEADKRSTPVAQGHEDQGQQQAVAPDEPQAQAQAQTQPDDRSVTEAGSSLAGGEAQSAQPVEHDMTAAQDDAKRATEVVSAATLQFAKYVPPSFPVSAQQRGVTGWVDVQLLVKTDGSVSDVIITGAEPVGVFEKAAVDAVKKWRYKPVERDGHAVDQRARLRMKFALDQ